jgi:hypothetical protein
MRKTLPTAAPAITEASTFFSSVVVVTAVSFEAAAVFFEAAAVSFEASAVPVDAAFEAAPEDEDGI